MTDHRKLYTGIGRVAWGYLFLFFHIKINTVSLLPTFAGYLLFLSAIRLLADEERALCLLRPLGILLAVWHGADWLVSWAGRSADGLLPVVSTVVNVVNIYFHFQLLTNLAAIAARYQSQDSDLDRKLLRHRTVQTILLTGVVILGYLSHWLNEVAAFLAVGMAIAYLVVGVLLMRALFALRRCLPANGPNLGS